MRSTAHHLFHWVWDILGGTENEAVYCGAYSAALYTVTANQITIPANAGGGQLHHCRGIWLPTVTFTWNGYWAKVQTVGAVDYFAGGTITNNVDSTVITLGTALADGTQVQVYYIYGIGSYLAADTAYGAYPAIHPSFVTAASYVYESAVDAEQWMVVALQEAARRANGTYRAVADLMMRSLAVFSALPGLQIINDFNDNNQAVLQGLYVTAGAGSTLAMSVENNQLKAVADIADLSYFGEWRAINVPAGASVQLQFKGTASNGLYKVTFNPHPSGTPSAANLYHAMFKDVSTDWVTITLPVADFVLLLNLIWDGERYTDNGWYAYGDGAYGCALATVAESFTVADRPHYQAQHAEIQFGAGTSYVGLGIDPPPGCESTAYAGISFWVRADRSLAQAHLIIYDAGDETWSIPITDLGTAGTAHTIPWASFTKHWWQPGTSDNNDVLNHPIKKIQLEFQTAELPGVSQCALWVGNIYFGAPIPFTDAISTYLQFDFPLGAYTHYFDDIKFDVALVDQWAGLPRFAYSWDAVGPLEWRGPMYTGYQVPAAYWLSGDTVTAARQAQFFAAAQAEYATRYSVTPGPFMPVWVPLSHENPAEWGGDVSTWTWAGPDEYTNWGGFMYRALAQLAHYYYLSADPVAKTVLDNWMTWLDTIGIQADGDGWQVPSVYVKDTGTVTYDYYSPEMPALIAQAMIFKYWRDGDATALLWYRRLLDDLVANRRAVDGSYPQQGGAVQMFHQAEVGKAFGMLLNGRSGATPSHALGAGEGDAAAFQAVYDFFTTNRGTAKPCSMDAESWVPLQRYDDVSQPVGVKLWISNSSTTSETVSISLYFALDYALWSGDFTWFQKLYSWFDGKMFNRVGARELSYTPVKLAVLQLDYCGRAFGVAPCTGSGEPCYNTWHTCKVRSAYLRGTKDYEFTSTEAPLPFPGPRPYLKSVTPLPTEIKDTLTVTGRLKVDLLDDPDTDIGIDPYVTQRATWPAIPGTYFKKLLARNPNYKTRTLEYYEGYLGDLREEFVLTGVGSIENIKLKGGVATIEAVDRLKSLAAIDIPPKTDLKLVIDRDAAASEFTLTSLDLLAASGYIRIGDEIIQYAALDAATNRLTGCTRALFGTVAVAHTAQDRVDLVRYYPPTNPFDLLMTLLTTDCGMVAGTDYNVAEFEYWRDWPGGEVAFSAIITEATKAETLFFEILDLLDCSAWVAEDLRITLRRNIPNEPGRVYDTLTDAAHISGKGPEVDLNDASRATRVILYWDKITLAADGTVASYKRGDIGIDPDAEGPNGYNEEAPKEIFCRWLRAGYLQEEIMDGFIQDFVLRRLLNLRDARPIITISVDLKDAALKTGGYLIMQTDELLTPAGLPISDRYQIVKRDPKGDSLQLKAQKLGNELLCFIAPDDAAAYDAATAEGKEYGYIADDDGLIDGLPGYVHW